MNLIDLFPGQSSLTILTLPSIQSPYGCNRAFISTLHTFSFHYIRYEVTRPPSRA